LTSLSKLDALEKKVHQLVGLVEELAEENKALKSQLHSLQQRQKDENMDSVTREIIRTKVQSMLSLLEQI
jgi:archaellum component FlaC